MIIEPGEKVHIFVRRNFEGELRRHFIGEVTAVQGSVVRLFGNSIVFDKTKNVFVKGKGERITIVDLAESGYIVNVIPKSVVISELVYKQNIEKQLVLTDEKSFTLDINEFGVSH